ncbi:MAG: hypothetical protein Tsb005_06540 [Gammaproteobacteria bacterium]
MPNFEDVRINHNQFVRDKNAKLEEQKKQKQIPINENDLSDLKSSIDKVDESIHQTQAATEELQYFAFNSNDYKNNPLRLYEHAYLVELQKFENELKQTLSAANDKVEHVKQLQIADAQRKVNVAEEIDDILLENLPESPKKAELMAKRQVENQQRIEIARNKAVEEITKQAEHNAKIIDEVYESVQDKLAELKGKFKTTVQADAGDVPANNGNPPRSQQDILQDYENLDAVFKRVQAYKTQLDNAYEKLNMTETDERQQYDLVNTAHQKLDAAQRKLNSLEPKKLTFWGKVFALFLGKDNAFVNSLTTSEYKNAQQAVVSANEEFLDYWKQYQNSYASFTAAITNVTEAKQKLDDQLTKFHNKDRASKFDLLQKEVRAIRKASGAAETALKDAKQAITQEANRVFDGKSHQLDNVEAVKAIASARISENEFHRDEVAGKVSSFAADKASPYYEFATTALAAVREGGSLYTLHSKLAQTTFKYPEPKQVVKVTEESSFNKTTNTTNATKIVQNIKSKEIFIPDYEKNGPVAKSDQVKLEEYVTKQLLQDSTRTNNWNKLSVQEKVKYDQKAVNKLAAEFKYGKNTPKYFASVAANKFAFFNSNTKSSHLKYTGELTKVNAQIPTYSKI